MYPVSSFPWRQNFESSGVYLHFMLKLIRFLSGKLRSSLGKQKKSVFSLRVTVSIDYVKLETMLYLGVYTNVNILFILMLNDNIDVFDVIMCWSCNTKLHYYALLSWICGCSFMLETEVQHLEVLYVYMYTYAK